MNFHNEIQVRRLPPPERRGSAYGALLYRNGTAFYAEGKTEIEAWENLQLKLWMARNDSISRI